jgi:membrane protease YdiL (CAAX protease family)
LTGLKILYAPFGSLNAPLSTAITAVAFALAVGFVEEGLFRGLLFGTLLPKGIVLSAIVSSVLFACFHLINLFSGVPWSYVASQLLFTLGLGSLFAALRVRAISIWPPILLHVLYDAPSLIMLGVNPNKVFDAASPLSFLVSGMMSLLCMAYAAYLLRPRQLARLSLVYDLQTQAGSGQTVQSRPK